ncbi:hypothetical protein D3C84_945060 [compost metagenome]
MPKTAKTSHHFIGDVQHPMPAADRKHPLVIARRRYDYPSRSEDRLGNETSDAIRAQLTNQLLELRDSLVTELLQRLAGLAQRRIGR